MDQDREYITPNREVAAFLLASGYVQTRSFKERTHTNGREIVKFAFKEYDEVSKAVEAFESSGDDRCQFARKLFHHQRELTRQIHSA